MGRTLFLLLGLLAAATFPLCYADRPKKEAMVVIPRVERMPNLPAPFHMRNWKQTAGDYVDFVFDFQKTGDYLPLIRWNDPAHETFFLPSYIGGHGPEAINCLAAVVSGTLIGRDMTRFRGQNWVKMCQPYFSKEDGVYTNNLHSRAADSFWYALFPNILFYQLAAHYPNVGDTQKQFTSVAAQWYKACVSMGGKTDPATLPNFDHTAFRFATMTPIDNGRWIEPDGAAGIAWLEYMAYRTRRNPRFLTAADWCLRALEQRPTEKNPLYEVLLPYGALAAVRMNAELGRDYDVQKLLNWCFEAGDRRSAREGWGVIADRFGNEDCDGLAGSVTDTDGYAFAMNTFQWAGALTPIARYDARYARSLGKWILNLANAARLFYPDALPADHQDGHAWAERFDPASSLSYEGLRKKSLRVEKTADGKSRVVVDPAVSPFATGDALRASGPSNLCLYGASHVGILGALIGRTDDAKILRLNLLQTDAFHDRAYPTFLLYNPYSVPKIVKFDVGPTRHDLYDAVRHCFVQTNVKDSASVTIPADSAVVIVSAPAGGAREHNGRHLLIDGVIVDYRRE